ncbi:MAG: tetratricopeptide repeat protein [Pseudomonadota bacterium]
MLTRYVTAPRGAILAIAAIAAFLGVVGPTVAQAPADKQFDAYERKMAQLKAAGRPDMAIRVGVEAMQQAKVRFGADHWQFSRAANNVGIMLLSQQRRQAAAKLFKMVLKIDRKIFSTKHPKLAVTMNNLALTYSGMGRQTEAASLLKSAARIQREVYGEDDPRFALTLKNLATLRQKQGKLEMAKLLLTKALSIYQTAFGKSDLRGAEILDQLSMVAYRLGDYKLSQQYLQAALPILTERLGENHSRIQTLKSVAQALRRHPASKGLPVSARAGGVAL